MKLKMTLKFQRLPLNDIKILFMYNMLLSPI